MSETPDRVDESATSPVDTLPPPPPPAAAVPEAHRDRPHRLFQVAAWVAIVAGTLFIVSMVFFSGFIMGRNSDGYGNGYDHIRRHHQMGESGAKMAPPMMPVPPGQMEPGQFGPGQFGPGSRPGGAVGTGPAPTAVPPRP